MLYLLLYVDDLVLTSNDSNLIITFIIRLNKTFSTKDLVKLTLFLGLKVTYTNNFLFLTQAKYAHDILTHVCLLESKPTTIPLVTTDQLYTFGVKFLDYTLC